jgi:hypothetical protein
MVFIVLLGSSFQGCNILGICVQWLLSSLAGTFQLQLPNWTNSLPTAKLTHKSKSKSKICYGWQSVIQSVLVSSSVWNPRPDFWYCQTVSCLWCGVPYLTRGQVCHLQLLLALASAVILWSESHGTHDHILLSQIWLIPNLEGQVPVFISLRNRVAQLYPQALGSLFVTSYNSEGYGGGIPTCLHVWIQVSKVKVKASLRLTVSQPDCLDVKPPPGAMTRFLLH